MVINTNLAASRAATQLTATSGALARSLQRLSSCSKIVSPADDSAGLAVSMKLTAQVARTGAALNNVSNAIAFAQTQDGYLQQVSAALTRMDELSVAAQDATKADSDRLFYSQEFDSLAHFINNVAAKQFNGVGLFSANPLKVVADSEGSTFTMPGVNLASTTYTNLLTDHVNIIGNGSTGAVFAMNDIKNVLSQLAADRATIGASIELLNYYSGALAAQRTSLQAANSVIADVDVAQESTNYARQNILVQSGTAMLAQANVLPNSVLKLIGGGGS